MTTNPDERDHFLVHIRVEHVTHTPGKVDPPTRSNVTGRRTPTRRTTVELFSTTMRGQSHSDILAKASKLLELERDMPSDPSLTGFVDEEDDDL